jgi:4-hydroxy-tetrahydrodipicolinate synthase
MLFRGLYPALVTPFDPEGRVNTPNLARLLAWHESRGAAGVVLAGTNGEGASLSPTERRDLVRQVQGVKGRLEVILGIPSTSLEEAKWQVSQAFKSGADGVLVSPPYFLKRAPEEGVTRWLEEVLNNADGPVILYHNPGVFGVGLPLAPHLLSHPRCAGVKNSAGDPELFSVFRGMLRDDQCLLVGDETLLGEALDRGATGSISGAANIVGLWLAEVLSLWPAPEARARLEHLLPLLRLIRQHPQPETHKALLHSWSLLDTPHPRLPLLAVNAGDLAQEITHRLGPQ